MDNGYRPGLNGLADEIHETAVDRGWWPRGGEVNIGTKLMLIVTEVSEAMEEYRDGHELTGVEYEVLGPEPHTYRRISADKYLLHSGAPGTPKGFATECADIIIRTLDLCAALGIDIDEAMRAKMAYNKTRPLRHGGKLV